jgi:ornithine cyclodeaminase/alanine dehydrogenase-like protein (mu-crystallin family)
LSPKILSDDDVARLARMPDMIAGIEAALMAKANGTLTAPPRVKVPVGGRGDLVFTVGGIGDSVAGFRAYHNIPRKSPDGAQLTAVWDQRSGTLKGIVTGDLLGEIRTGAIGGVAVKLLARADADSVAIIGSGAQARTQLAAVTAVRKLKKVMVFSRSPEKRDRFAADMGKKLKLPIGTSASAKDAVRDAAIVICATDSTQPVIRAEWIGPGTHVTTVGPKQQGQHELDPDIAINADVIATDSPAQIAAYDPLFFLRDALPMERVIDLADIAAGKHAGRQSDDDITLFCSAGLAGTEVLLADRLLEMV